MELAILNFKMILKKKSLLLRTIKIGTEIGSYLSDVLVAEQPLYVLLLVRKPLAFLHHILYAV